MKMFKSKKTVALILTAMTLFSFSGCGSKTNNSSSSNSASSEGKPVKLVFATDGVGSSTYTIGSAMATMLKEYLPKGSTIDVQPISPGGLGAPYLFENGTADITFINGAPAKAAYTSGTLGKPATQKYKALAGHLTNVAAVTYFSTDFVKKHGVNTLEDVVAKKIPIRVGTSPKGSMDEWVAGLVFKKLGVSYDDIKSWGGDVVQAGGAQLSNMLKDGKIDMILNHTSQQSSDVTQDSMTVPVTFVQMGDDLLNYFVSQGFEKIKYPAGLWKGMDKDIIYPGTPDCLYVSSKVSDDIAYALTKGLIEKRDDLVKQFASITPFDPKTAWTPESVGGVPLSAGAEKYYKEAGLMK
jgi:TRAP transporter TAXI family solute receptor